MKRNLHRMLVRTTMIISMSLLVFPAAAQSSLSKEMAKKWGDKCIPTEKAMHCCEDQRNGETACKGLEKERAGSPVVRNCEDAENLCQTMVREAKKTEGTKIVQQGIPRLPSPAELEKELDDAKNDLVKIEEQLSKVASKGELEELKKRCSKDRETIDRVKTILEGRQRSVIETNPPAWTPVKQQTTDVAAKLKAVENKILHCQLAGDVTKGGDSPGKHVVGCKFNF
jgi:carboxypeptidase C (cathepsin A)